MIVDQTPRWVKVGDAISQLINVALLPQHTSTTANESISGRCHRCGWRTAELVINFLFLWMERDHCRVAHLNDVTRAVALLEAEGVGK
jgi:hypothetical protein